MVYVHLAMVTLNEIVCSMSCQVASKARIEQFSVALLRCNNSGVTGLHRSMVVDNLQKTALHCYNLAYLIFMAGLHTL